MKPRTSRFRGSAVVALTAIGLWTAADLAGLSPTCCLAQDEVPVPQPPAEGFDDSFLMPDPSFDGLDPSFGEGQEPPRRRRRGRPDSTRRGEQSAVKGSSSRPARDQGVRGGKSSGLSFARDVAPILVARCIGCHSPGRAGADRGKFEMTTFAGLMKGSSRGRVIVPGQVAESRLLRRIRGDETPQMPQDGDPLEPELIAQIEWWVGRGARLDPELDPAAPIASYAASLSELRKAQLARLDPRERDRRVEAAGRDRWKQANPKVQPEVVAGSRFILFSKLPKDRAANLVKAMDGQYGQLRRMLGPSAVDWVQKIGLYVFHDRNDFIEFIRTVENRSVDPGILVSAKLAIDEPYIAAVDPLRGQPEERGSGPRRRPGRGRPVSAASDGASARSLLGLLTEGLGEGAVLAHGSSPRWLAWGVGAYLGAQVEPGHPEFFKLRETAARIYDNEGWPTKAAEALGETDRVSTDEIRAVGFAIVEFLMSPPYRQHFPAFAQAMSRGPEKLDDALRDVFRVSREEFLASSGEWVALEYGSSR
jgi:hypothetical protein